MPLLREFEEARDQQGRDRKVKGGPGRQGPFPNMDLGLSNVSPIARIDGWQISKWTRMAAILSDLPSVRTSCGLSSLLSLSRSLGEMQGMEGTADWCRPQKAGGDAGAGRACGHAKHSAERR